MRLTTPFCLSYQSLKLKFLTTKKPYTINEQMSTEIIVNKGNDIPLTNMSREPIF